MVSVWYYVRNGAQNGPVSFDELKNVAASGQITPADLVWQQGTADWVPAQTVQGLFAPSQAIATMQRPLPFADTLDATPAPASPRAPLPAPSRPVGRQTEPGTLYDAPPPTTPVGQVLAMANEFLRRATVTNPDAIVPTPHEEDCLAQAELHDATTRQYALWRRAMLWVAAVPAAFAALFGFINVLALDKEASEALSGFGALVLFVGAVSLFALPICAILAANAYDQLRTSMRLVLLGAAISLGMPLVIVFMPERIMFDMSAVNVSNQATMLATRILLGINFYLLLLPPLLAFLPAVSRACIRLKTLLPQSLVPGWVLVASLAPFFILTLGAFGLLYQFVGNGLLILGLILWVGAPLLYLWRFSLLTRPLTEKRNLVTLANMQLAVLGAIMLGVLLLIIYLFTSHALGRSIVGSDRDASWLRPWSLEIHKKWLEYIGWTVFLTVLVADLLMQMSIWVWREERAAAGTEGAAQLDQTMTALGGVFTAKSES
jgi:hypothetical protein